MNRLSRRQFVAGSSAFASIAFIRSPARAAQFDYKFAHGTPTSFPVAVRTTQMWDAVREQTGGKLDVKSFPNNVLGSELAQLSQLRSGAIQFMIIQGVSLSSVVPTAQIDGVGFAFKDSAQAEHAFDGPLGEWVRKEIAAKGIFAFPNVFNFGMREVASSTHPIRTSADFAGFKIRTPPSQITVDLFKTLGASPTPIVFPELYTSLQTKIVEGLELPYSAIESNHFYEVTKYLSVTNHTATIFWFLGNVDAWNGLGPDIQAIVLKNAHQAAILERLDTAQQSAALANKLARLGLTFNTADTSTMRAQLAPFYNKWKAFFGQAAWDLLEQTAGKLG